MRLQLIACALGLAGSARADDLDEPTARASIRVYADDDHVTVISPSALVRARAAAGLTLAADVTVDAVTAASVDVVTSASPRTVHEQRVEAGLAATRRQGRATWLSVGARGSHENDYDALRVRAAGRHEFAERNTTLELAYVFGADAASSVIDPDFHAHRTSHEGIATASQLLSPRTVVDVIADATVANGYHASPYRDVLVDVVGSPLVMRISERTPERHASLAIAGRVRQAIGSTLAASSTYRYYRDDWGIASHTLTAQLFHQRGPVLLGVEARGYAQTAASFYRAHYEVAGELPTLRTRDRTLGAMRSAYAALTADATVGRAEAWHVIGALGAMRFWFVDFPAQANRDALIVHAGVSTSW